MMSPLPRNERKTCLACAGAKRTCDKHFPKCQRCTEKNLDCQYPTTRRYARASSTSARRARVRAGDALIPDVANPQPQAPRRQPNITDEARPLTPNSSTGTAFRYKPWFKGPEAWEVRPVDTSMCRFNPGPIRSSSGAKIWSTSLGDWLRHWVEKGHNPFIHRELYYDTGLPQCLQDAWTTATAYFSKTALNEHIVLNIIENRADGLVLQAQVQDNASFMAVPGPQTIDHLARVQALFIYQVIRLYDGSIRQRALAENCFQTLLPWCQQLWQSATSDAYQETPLPGSAGLDRLDPSDEMASLPHWKSWILSESVRRTWLVCHSTFAAYFRERDGWNTCTGEIRFTACEGLWDAASSTSWAELASRRDPLFVQSLHVDELLSTAMAMEVDIFSKIFMTLLMGKERIDSWAANGLCAVGSSGRLGPLP